MTILRVTHFRWGDTINNWYSNWDAVNRQLACEADREPIRDVTYTEWFECKPVSPECKPSMPELLAWNKQGGQID